MNKSTLLHGLTTLAFAMFFACFAPVAKAETVNCTAITSLPYTVTTSGIYCLTGNLVIALPTGAAVEVDSDDVVIDLNGYKIENTEGSTTQANGIDVGTTNNVTIKNGTIRGFYTGIRQWTDCSSSGLVVDGIKIDNAYKAGIDVYATGAIVRNNRIRNNIVTNGRFFGIMTNCADATIVNNDVYVSAGGPTVDAIRADVEGAVIENNRVKVIAKTGPGISRGIYMAGGINTSMVVNNRLKNVDYGIYLTPPSGVKYRDNIVSGATISAYYGSGVNIGNNN